MNSLRYTHSTRLPNLSHFCRTVFLLFAGRGLQPRPSRFKYEPSMWHQTFRTGLQTLSGKINVASNVSDRVANPVQQNKCGIKRFGRGYPVRQKVGKT
jgi:hypothetical protein